MKLKIFLLISLLASTFAFSAPSLPPHPTVQELKKALHVKVVADRKEIPEGACRMILVHHGNTEWTEVKRLQGWSHLPLSERGREEARSLAEKIAEHKVSAIYSSSLQSAEETAKILEEKLSTGALSTLENLKGEDHGQFEGFTAREYLRHPHFQLFYFIPAEEKIFFPRGKGGESSADVGRRAAPALREIAMGHGGETVVVVSHDALFRLFNFFSGKSKKEETISVPHGEIMEIAVDAGAIYLLRSS